MKHKHVVIVGILIVISLTVFGVYQAWPKPSTPDIPRPTETKKISSSQSIGGQVDAPADPSSPSSPDSTPKQEEQPQDTSIPSNAPKQDEIARKVTKEYPYYALLSSNDPLSASSWALTNTNARLGWDTATGNGTIIAVIDSGYALAHEDLSSQWHTNDGEIGMTTSGDTCWSGSPEDKQTNACDDDNNGYVDDWRGWNFVDQTNNPQAGLTNPTGQGVSHGTQVAGLAGARGNNGIGIATMSWNNKVMPLQALDDDGSGFTSDIAAAIYYATDNGAKVINMSLGSPYNDPAVKSAIEYAYTNNVVVVAAAGNCGTGTESNCDPAQPGVMGYPALYPHVIAVGAITSSDSRASFSSYGPGLDVVAPGSGSIVSTMWTQANQTSAYSGSLYGTSFASPMVASYVGLIRSIRPASSVDDVTALVDASARKVSGMSGEAFTEEYGHGIIDANTGMMVASSLGAGATSSVSLAQSGSELSEHTFQASSMLSSGCKVNADKYCTVWARDDNGFDRYLPYVKANGSGSGGWQWGGSVLGGGNWQLRARSGDVVSSTSYALFMK